MRSILLLVPLFVLVPRMAQAQAAPATGKSPTTADASVPRVDVHFSTAEAGVTVYARPVPRERSTAADVTVREPEFEPVCQAPCEAKLEPRIHEFALAPAGGTPLPATPAFELREDARFRGDIVSHEAERRAGWWILGIMGTVGITSTTIGMLQTCVDDQTCQEWTSLAIWSGFAVTTAGALIGLPMIVKSDEATLTLYPGRRR